MLEKRYFCDRCGKEKKDRPAVNIATENKLVKDVAWVTLASRSSYKKELDLCEDCLKSFKTWFEGHE